MENELRTWKVAPPALPTAGALQIKEADFPNMLCYVRPRVVYEET